MHLTRRIGRAVFLSSLVSLLLAPAVSAQTAKFTWIDELCTYTGTYDTKKYSAAQLRDTLSLLRSGGESGVGLHVWKYEDIEKLDIAAYDRQFKERLKKIRELDIVKHPYWEELRQAIIKEMTQVYELTRTTAVAYTRPEAISEYPRAEGCKQKYAGPLAAGGESLVAAWREVNLASQKVNADPKRLQDRFDRQNASPDRLKFALVETMNFGWWNCAVALIERPRQMKKGAADLEFRKLFRRVREACDEP